MLMIMDFIVLKGSLTLNAESFRQDFANSKMSWRLDASDRLTIKEIGIMARRGSSWSNSHAIPFALASLQHNGGCGPSRISSILRGRVFTP
jgi:hypothetical protein